MSDNARQSFTDKASSAMKPDSEKSTTEHMGDKMKGTMDSGLSSVQPQSDKSMAQKAGDTMSGNSNKSSDSSMLDKAKDTMGMGDRK